MIESGVDFTLEIKFNMFFYYLAIKKDSQIDNIGIY